MSTSRGNNVQQNWFALVKHFGEKPQKCPKTRAYMASRLREAAVHVETAEGLGKWPDVYGVTVSLPGEFMEGTDLVASKKHGKPIPNMLGEVSVWFSHPWPG